MTESMTEPASSKRFYPMAWLSIIRPQNCFIGGLSVIAGVAMAYNIAAVSTISVHIPLFIYGYITYFFVAAGGNVVNDIFDVEVDKINRPHRALPSGRMTIRQAWAYVAFLSFVGLLFALLTGIYSALIVLCFLIIGYVYAAKVKTLGLAGNFMVAFSFAFGILYGAFAYAETVGFILTWDIIPIPNWLFFFTAFLILQARETIKGAEDVEGDRARDVQTIARVYGYRAAAGVAAALNFIGVISYVLIWIMGYASWDLWILLVLGSGIVLGAGVAPLTGPDSKRSLLIGSTLDKIGALVGLITFVIIPLYEILL
ncbi:MAG: geranylgeranylglycerol-phosphate geranylgeranyltransferase [Candidatus Thorarchaeota archaeon]